MEYIPNSDFNKLAQVNIFRDDEILLRTYFKQLVSAVNYLHVNNIAHMDIKLDNLMLGANFELKLIDFDFALTCRDSGNKGRGTKNYRAPEVKVNNIEYP